MIYIGYSQGTTIGTWALNADPEYFDQRFKLFVALAPTVLFEHMGEEELKQLANSEVITGRVAALGFLEVNGKDRKKKPDELMGYVRENLGFICYMSPKACEPTIDFFSEEGMEHSPSVSLKRSNRERLPIFIASKGGTSFKNIMHMG
jgi:pimeloyl-ACP methyl ester carboxylesterase